MHKFHNFFKTHIIPNFLVLIGSTILAIGNALFLVELNIVTGGLNGIGIIIQHFVDLVNPDLQVIDIFVFIATWSLWVVGFIFLGKEFAFKTLLSSIVYPIIFAICIRNPFFQEFSRDLAYADVASATTDVGRILLCGIFGGLSVGGGLALTFIGGGSTGGLDVITFLIEKHLRLKQSITILILDGTIVLLGMFIIPNNLVSGLCGIIAATIASFVIEIVYVGSQTCLIADIISDKWEDISAYAQDKLLRGATIITAIGGYQGDQRPILRIVIPKAQYHALRNYIHEIDPKAFVTFTQTNAVFGEGFQESKSHKKKTKKQAKHG